MRDHLYDGADYEPRVFVGHESRESLTTSSIALLALVVGAHITLDLFRYGLEFIQCNTNNIYAVFTSVNFEMPF